MNAMKKTVLATAILLSMGATAAEAAATNFTFAGSFLMYDGTDPANSAMFNSSSAYVGPLGSGSFLNYTSPTGIMNNGNGAAGDPISGTMSVDMNPMSPTAGQGTATMVGTPFFGDSWSATNVAFTGIGPGLEHVTMLFNWGAPAAVATFNGEPTMGDCGMINCNIHVAVDFQMYPTANPLVYGFYTTGSWMVDGPFAGAQPTFSGYATVQMPTQAPIPAAAWLLGSGLLGLVGVARRKAA